MDKIEKMLIKKKPQSPQISAISTNNNYYNTTLSTNTYYNTQLFNTVQTEKLTPPATSDLNIKGEKENNFYHNTKTSFFSLALTNPKTIQSENNNDDLSFSNLF
jgi:hypothetical protein